jgi:hypothetical protein
MKIWFDTIMAITVRIMLVAGIGQLLDHRCRRT